MILAEVLRSEEDGLFGVVRRCFAYANLAKTNPATTPRFWNCSFCSARLRRNRFSPRLCKRPSLHVRDTLPFDRLTRNFKRNSSCYERTGRNFDRNGCGVARTKDDNSKCGRRNAPVAKRSGCPRRSRAAKRSQEAAPHRFGRNFAYRVSDLRSYSPYGWTGWVKLMKRIGVEPSCG